MDFLITMAGVVIGGAITSAISYIISKQNQKIMREVVSLEKEAEGISELNNILHDIHRNTLHSLENIIKKANSPKDPMISLWMVTFEDSNSERTYESSYFKYSPFIGQKIKKKMSAHFKLISETKDWIKELAAEANKINKTIENKRCCYYEHNDFYSAAANYAQEKNLKMPLRGNNEDEFYEELWRFYSDEKNRDKASIFKDELLASFSDLQNSLSEYVNEGNFSNNK